jgi:hypothetical protein
VHCARWRYWLVLQAWACLRSSEREVMRDETRLTKPAFFCVALGAVRLAQRRQQKAAAASTPSSVCTTHEWLTHPFSFLLKSVPLGTRMREPHKAPTSHFAKAPHSTT